MHHVGVVRAWVELVMGVANSNWLYPVQTAARNGEHYYIRAATNISSEEEDIDVNAEPQVLTFTSAVSWLKLARASHLFAVTGTKNCSVLWSRVDSQTS